MRGERIKIKLKAGPTLNAILVFLGIRTSIAEKPYIFVIFQRGSAPPVPPPLLDPHMALVCANKRNNSNVSQFERTNRYTETSNSDQFDISKGCT